MDCVISSILVLLLTCTTIHVLSNKIRRKRNYKLPPGPSPLNLVGNIVELGKKPQQTLAKLAKIHGPIMRLKLGQLTTIVISSPDIAKEVFQTHDLLFSNRTIPHATTVHNHNHNSVAFLPISPLWRDLRKICNSQLFSHKSLDASQNLRHKKLEELLRDVHRSSLSGEAVDIGTAAFRTSINFLSNIFFSLDFVTSVGETEEYKGIVENLARAIATPNVEDFFPLVKMVDPQGIRRRSSAYVSKLFVIFDRLIDKRMEFGDATNNDMLDTLLNISQEDGQKMDHKKIKHLFLDLLVAGTDTTSYTTEWAMTELINNPDIMSKAKRELEQTIGIGNPIEESDIARLPYLGAIIKETLRLHPGAPLLLPRKANINVEIHGYTIPQGAQIVINEWAIGRNPSIWDNPNLFSPDRFLGSDIDVKGRHSQLTPFGGGRRICPGLPLAMRMLHLMLGSLINAFDWKFENDANPDIDMRQPLRAIPFRINKPN
ncbi:Geraniol 8-hydroxylase [Spatholobus suberectus]|nr:Geraniol 8-hydroxylase [Spatholobus suberectus]